MSLQAIALVVLSVSAARQEQMVILIPPDGVQGKYTISQSSIPDGYLAQLGMVVVHALFTSTPATSENLVETILRITHPDAYASVEKNLATIVRDNVRNKVTTVFHPRRVRADAEGMVVRIEGSYSRKVSSTDTVFEDRIYDLQFALDTGRVWFVSLARHEGAFDEGIK